MIVVMPMAGRGSRFANKGVRTPKPLIRVAGRPMVAWALESLRGLNYSQLIFVALREHEDAYGITELLRGLTGDRCRVILIDQVTEGQLCTVLSARESIDTSEDVLIASADTYIQSNLGDDIAHRSADCRGIISVAELPGDHWSFARIDPQGRVVEVAEKARISDLASTGLYYFADGAEMVRTADEVITKQQKTQGEFYVIPMYQKYIDRGCRIEVSIAGQVWDMGSPAALKAFQRDIIQPSKAWRKNGGNH